MKKLFSIVVLLLLVATASATVTNWGGNTFTGLHSDSKPTVIDGSRFFEIDSPYGAYIRSSGTWTLISGVSSGGSGSSSLTLGETSTTAYRGDRGKTAYDHSQTMGNPHSTTTGSISDSTDKRYVTDTQLSNIHALHADDQDLSSYALSTHNHSGVYEAANANIQSHITNSSNPHSVTKTQVGLGNVDNTADTNKPISSAVTSTLANYETISALTATLATKETVVSSGLSTQVYHGNKTWGAVNLASDVSNSLPDANITSAATWNAKQNALTYPVTGVASPTTNYLTKWSGTNTLADAFKYGTLTDAKWCSYTTASGFECTQNAPAGSGDVTGGSSSANGEFVVYSGTGGKTIKQSGLGTGILRLGASAVPSVGNVNLSSEVTGSLPDTSLSFTDNTTGNSSTSAHGYAPKGTAGTTQYWRQDWTLGTPGGGSSNYVQVSSVTTAATTSLVNITGLSWSLAANTPFSFLCGVIMSSATTTAGPRVSLTGPASPTHFSVSTSFLNTVTTLATANTITTYGGLTATCITSCDNVSKRVMTINGAGLNGSNAGTIQLQVQSSATGTVTVHEGSYCTYW